MASRCDVSCSTDCSSQKSGKEASGVVCTGSPSKKSAEGCFSPLARELQRTGEECAPALPRAAAVCPPDDDPRRLSG
jgi:hypothetical protein